MALLKKKDRPSTGKKRFEYRPITEDQVLSRKNQQGGAREGFVQSEIPVWSPKEGENTVRILPPTWEDASGLGYELYAHYQIGPDNSSYLCLQQMKKEDCPICEERAKADKEGDDELAYELKPKKRVAVYIIDRAQERKGPQLWIMPWTLDRDIASVMFDKREKKVLQVAAPGGSLSEEEGYDLTFEKEKKKGQQFFDYVGVQFERKPSPLSDDDQQAEEWLAFTQENPIPDVLVYADYDHIKEVFGGEITESKASKKRRKDEEEEKPKKSKLKSKDEEEEEEEKPVKKSKPKDEEEEEEELPTWDEVHEMDEDELTELIEKADLSLKKAEQADDAHDWVCEQLGIEPTKKSKPKDEEEEEEEEEKPRKSKLKAKDEEEEEKPRKSKLKAKDEEEEEEEEEKPTKKDWKDRLKKFKK